MKTSKSWGITFIIMTTIILVGIAGLTVFVDPYFHYHKPFSFFEYNVENETFKNDGLARNMDYDALIIGSCMVERFDAHECNELFDCSTLITRYRGEDIFHKTYGLRNAIKRNPNLKNVFWGLDARIITQDSTGWKNDFYNGDLPTYLYDNYIFNDVKYVFNKDVLLGEMRELISSYDRNLNNVVTGGITGETNCSKDIVLAIYGEPEEIYNEELDIFSGYSDSEIQNISNILDENIISIVSENPDITFYFFFTPFSILSWNETNIKSVQADCKLAVELLLQYDNAKIYSFFDDYDLICDLNNYTDKFHYGKHVNSLILHRISQGKNQLTKDNYLDYFDETTAFYCNYNYNEIFQ